MLAVLLTAPVLPARPIAPDAAWAVPATPPCWIPLYIEAASATPPATLPAAPVAAASPPAALGPPPNSFPMLPHRFAIEPMPPTIDCSTPLLLLEPLPAEVPPDTLVEEGAALPGP